MFTGGMGVYTGLLGTSVGLLTTGSYLNALINSVQPTVNFLYNNFLTNPYVIVIILVLLVLSLFTFSD